MHVPSFDTQFIILSSDMLRCTEIGLFVDNIV